MTEVVRYSGVVAARKQAKAPAIIGRVKHSMKPFNPDNEALITICRDGKACLDERRAREAEQAAFVASEMARLDAKAQRRAELRAAMGLV